MRGKIYMAYFPFVLVCIQFLINVAFLLGMTNDRVLFYANTFFGTNFFFAVFLVCYTNFFHFCRIYRWASYAELALAIDVIVVQDDSVYNIVFQCIIIACALILTALSYSKLFPTCMMSMVTIFIKKVLKNKFHCEKALEDFKENRYKVHRSKYIHHGR